MGWQLSNKTARAGSLHPRCDGRRLQLEVGDVGTAADFGECVAHRPVARDHLDILTDCQGNIDRVVEATGVLERELHRGRCQVRDLEDLNWRAGHGVAGIEKECVPNPSFKKSASHGVAKLGVQGTRRAERDLIGAQGFKEESRLRNELLIVEKPLDRDGGVENNSHALTRSVSKLAQVRKRPWESAVLSPDLIAKGLDASEERILGLGAGLSGQSLDEVLHFVLKGSWKGLDFLEEFRGAHSVLGRAILQRPGRAPDTTSRGLGLRLGRPHPLDELRQHLNATNGRGASPAC